MKSVIIATLALVSIAGCGPTVGEALDRIAPPLCARMKECFGDAFDAAKCEQAAKNSVPAADRSKIDACTNDEVDTCVNDIHSMSCPSTSTDVMSHVPASCKKC